MTKIKICGLTREEDIRVVNACKPEFIGFLFYEKSIRNISPERAVQLRQLVDPKIQVVCVFRNEAAERVAQIAKKVQADYVQLHGDEDEAYIEKLRRLLQPSTIPIIQAFSVSGEEDVKRACESSAEEILLDSGSGGTGTAFDWRWLEQVTRPYFLAGGLNPGNVGEAVKRWRPYAVDVSSGVETDKVKDENKIRAFIRACRMADEEA